MAVPLLPGRVSLTARFPEEVHIDGDRCDRWNCIIRGALFVYPFQVTDGNGDPIPDVTTHYDLSGALYNDARGESEEAAFSVVWTDPAGYGEATLTSEQTADIGPDSGPFHKLVMTNKVSGGDPEIPPGEVLRLSDGEWSVQ